MFRRSAAERLEVSELSQGLYRVFAYYGFMQSSERSVALRDGALWLNINRIKRLIISAGRR